VFVYFRELDVINRQLAMNSAKCASSRAQVFDEIVSERFGMRHNLGCQGVNPAFGYRYWNKDELAERGCIHAGKLGEPLLHRCPKSRNVGG
jgi:hypothetical protein